MKNIAAMHLAAMLALNKFKGRFKRDIIFAATADEECGGEVGIRWMLDNHPELLRAEYALSEFGGFSMSFRGKRFYLCQSAEKGGVAITMRAKGMPGHGSMPHDDSAVVYLSKAIAKLTPTATPLHVSATTRTMIEALSQTEPALQNLLSPETNRQVLSQMPIEEALMFNAILRNSVAVTGLKAGYKHNVIPGVAEADLDCRLIPGQSPEDMVREIQEIVGPEIELIPSPGLPGIESDSGTPLFKALERNLKRFDPEAEVVPWLLTGGTDGRFLPQRECSYYGYAPLRLPEEFAFLGLVHGHNERVPIDPFREGTRVFIETVLDFCS